MSKKNPEYDFAWCPGCGDFGVRRAVEFALTDRLKETEEIIPSETPEDIWDLIQENEKKNTK